MLDSVLKKVFGTKHAREVKRMQPMVSAISALEPEMQKLSDAQLRGKTADFRQQLDNGAPLVRKPFTPAQLLEAIDTVLAGEPEA